MKGWVYYANQMEVCYEGVNLLCQSDGSLLWRGEFTIPINWKSTMKGWVYYANIIVCLFNCVQMHSCKHDNFVHLQYSPRRNVPCFSWWDWFLKYHIYGCRFDIILYTSLFWKTGEFIQFMGGHLSLIYFLVLFNIGNLTVWLLHNWNITFM
jgi:hypothetical protein